MNDKIENPSSKFFNGKSIGKSLKEVAVDLIETDSDRLVSRWFHSDMNTDLFTWMDKGQNIIKQQISFHGQVVEWNCLEGIKTGLVVESDFEVYIPTHSAPKSGAHGKGTVGGLGAESKPQSSETIQFDSNPQMHSIDLALEILNHFEIDSHLHHQLIGNFKDPQNIKTMSPKTFVDRFGISLKEYQTQDPSFWDSVKKKLQSLFWG